MTFPVLSCCPQLVYGRLPGQPVLPRLCSHQSTRPTWTVDWRPTIHLCMHGKRSSSTIAGPTRRCRTSPLWCPWERGYLQLGRACGLKAVSWRCLPWWNSWISSSVQWVRPPLLVHPCPAGSIAFLKHAPWGVHNKWIKSIVLVIGSHLEFSTWISLLAVFSVIFCILQMSDSEEVAGTFDTHCNQLKIPHFRLSPKLSEHVKATETNTLKLINMLYDTRCYLHDQDEKVLKRITEAFEKLKQFPN